MLSITRKVEYALIGLAHLASKDKGAVITVREVSETYQIPGKLLAKVFHEMKTAKLLRSHQGKNGGYSLAREPKDVTLTEVIKTIEGNSDLVSCSSTNGQHCPQLTDCNIQSPMEALNCRLRSFLDSVTLETFSAEKKETPGN